ncbi:MAG TPA: TRAP transporter substrate-binding protein [Hyphomicrobiales bacterium]|nr:TRAP transporter substrate-binding protein [Rhodobiaceae bacterium]HXK53136.1 TRAP transporter substrate-binding protein [Hyphomicrobiales bacterium]
MDRRSFLKRAGLAGGVAATALAAPALAQGSTELKLVTSWPKNFPGLGTAPERFAQRVEKATDGRYKIRVFAGGELVHPLKVNDAVQEGTAELYHAADYYFQGKVKAYAFFTAVPFGFRPDEMDAWIQHGGGQALWDEVGANFGIKHLPCGNTGSQMGGWFNRPMKSVEDFKGLKMRIPGLGGDVIKALGGTSVTLAGSEILPALQSGNVDAAEWVGPWNDLAFGFYKVVKFYHYPGFHEPGSMLGIGMSKKLWDGLSETDKTIFEACALAENNYDLAEFNANNTQALDTLINKHGVELVEFSDDIYKEFGKAAKDVLASAGASDPLTKKVYDSFLDFRKKAVRWSDLSDQSYMNKRSLTEF